MRKNPQTQTYTGYTAEKLAENFADAYVKDGVVYWKSNDRTPFEDMVTDFAEAGFVGFESIELTNKARSEQNKAIIAQYCNAQVNRTQEQIAEERFEARAAMGAGVKMVNIFTGERYTT